VHRRIEKEWIVRVEGGIADKNLTPTFQEKKMRSRGASAPSRWEIAFASR